MHLGVAKSYRLYRQGTPLTSASTLVTNLGQAGATFVLGRETAKKTGLQRVEQTRESRAELSFNHGDFSASDIVKGCADRQFLLLDQVCQNR